MPRSELLSSRVLATKQKCLWIRITEGHPSQFFLETLLLGAVRAMHKLISQFEEGDFLAFFRFETAFDQVDNHTVCARPAAFCESLNTPGDC